MKDVTVDLGLVGFVRCFNAVLQDRSTSARKGVCHHSRRYEVVRMQDEHVVGIIDDALTCTIEVPNQMNVGPRGAGAVEPGLSKGDRFVGFCLFVLEKQNLIQVSRGKTVAEVYR